jgi:hypothetical protein
MPKSSRWICRDCARICVSRAALAKEWCACGHYLLPDPQLNGAPAKRVALAITEFTDLRAVVAILSNDECRAG